MKLWKVLAASLLALGACARVQAQAQIVAAVQPAAQSSVYPSNIVSSAMSAAPGNDVRRADSTKADSADSKGMDLAPDVADRAKALRKRGAIKLAAEFQGFQRPTTFRNDYLTYVMWPISADGRRANLSEMSVDNHGRGALYRPDQTLDLRSPMQEVKTLFATQSRVLIGQFWGGRIQISEIGGTLNMQNVILGPSGSDGLLDYHPPRRNEPNLPRPIAFNGFSVRFELGRNAPAERRAEVWRCLAWIRGDGRRCQL
ncbi:MAG: hypothetical protein ACYDD2_09760 [Candidatus Acidiferrales bacterium]